MSYLDSSVLVSSLMPDDPDHVSCDALLNQAGNWTSAHALNETFASLTGGKLGMRVDADVAAQMIRESIVPCVSFAELNVDEIIAAQSSARKQGVRGGSIYDYMHLVAARKTKADVLFTLNLSDFLPCIARAIRISDVHSNPAVWAACFLRFQEHHRPMTAASRRS